MLLCIICYELIVKSGKRVVNLFLLSSKCFACCPFSKRFISSITPCRYSQIDFLSLFKKMMFSLPFSGLKGSEFYFFPPFTFSPDVKEGFVALLVKTFWINKTHINRLISVYVS